MFKSQFKTRTPFEKWSTLGSYGSESQAISAALTKKRGGAMMVRVINKAGHVVYAG